MPCSTARGWYFVGAFCVMQLLNAVTSMAPTAAVNNLMKTTLKEN